MMVESLTKQTAILFGLIALFSELAVANDRVSDNSEKVSMQLMKKYYKRHQLSYSNYSTQYRNIPLYYYANRSSYPIQVVYLPAPQGRRNAAVGEEGRAYPLYFEE